MSMIWSRATAIALGDSGARCSIGWWNRRARTVAIISNSIPGVQRFDAHRFYLLKRMNISSYHFRIKISDEAMNL